MYDINGFIQTWELELKRAQLALGTSYCQWIVDCGTDATNKGWDRMLAKDARLAEMYLRVVIAEETLTKFTS